MAASLPRDLILSRLCLRPSRRCLAFYPSQRASFHSNSAHRATPLPIPVLGPALTPPTPTPTPSSSSSSSNSSEDYLSPLHRKRQHALLLSRARTISYDPNRAPASITSPPSSSTPDPSSAPPPPPRTRFWTHTAVHTTPTHHEIHLDARPVRTSSKQILRVPLGKLHLAHAIALEWDVLTNAAQALRNHAVPLTAMVSRVMDIQAEEEGEAAAKTASGPGASAAAESGTTKARLSIRKDIEATVLPYLDTDTLLCWAPSSPSSPNHVPRPGETHSSLRDLQASLAKPVLAALRATILPNAEFHTDVTADSIIPPRQPEQTREQIEKWIAGLGAWELVGLERAVLAGKSLLVGIRLVEEWRDWNPRTGKTEGEGAARRGGDVGSGSVSGDYGSFGIEEAAQACSAEVGWQTRQWGEVEDTHDVEKEDLRRQFGSVVLIVAGKDGREDK